MEQWTPWTAKIEEVNENPKVPAHCQCKCINLVPLGPSLVPPSLRHSLPLCLWLPSTYVYTRITHPHSHTSTQPDSHTQAASRRYHHFIMASWQPPTYDMGAMGFQDDAACSAVAGRAGRLRGAFLNLIVASSDEDATMLGSLRNPLDTISIRIDPELISFASTNA
jgi:hypothetical protein